MKKTYIFIVTLTVLTLVSCTKDVQREVVIMENDVTNTVNKPQEISTETNSWIIESSVIYSSDIYNIRKIDISYSGGLKDIAYEIDISSHKINVASIIPPYNIELAWDRLYYSFDFPDGSIHKVFDLKTWKELASFGWELSEDKNYVTQCYETWYDAGTVKVYDRKLLLEYSIVDFGNFVSQNKTTRVLKCEIEKDVNWEYITFTTSDSPDIYIFSLSTKDLTNTSKNIKIKINGVNINNAQ